MSLTNEGMGAADLAAIMGRNDDGFGFGGDGAWWLIILFLFMFNGNWGNGFGGYGGGVGSEVQRGFDQSAVMSGLSGIQASLTNGFVDTGAALCNGFAGVNGAIANGFAQAEISANARQMADMNQEFAAQMAMAQGFNQLGSQFAQCCCDNRLASADLKYTIATENCADRTALADGVRDILESQNAGIQRILDTMCQDKIDAKNDEIAQLRQEILYARGQASQIAQNQQIVDSIYNRLDTCPVGTTPVYGKTPIFTCNNGCGCSGSTMF